MKLLEYSPILLLKSDWKRNGRNQENEERVCRTQGRNSGADWQAGQAWKVIHKRFTKKSIDFSIQKCYNNNRKLIRAALVKTEKEAYYEICNLVFFELFV